MCRITASAPADGPVPSTSARPSRGETRTVAAPCGSASVVVSVQASSSIWFGGRSATPWEASVRRRSTGSPPAPTSSSSFDQCRANLPLRPGPDAADSLDAHVNREARRRIVHRRKLDVRAEVDVGQLLQQLGSAALLDLRAAVDDEVLLQPG